MTTRGLSTLNISDLLEIAVDAPISERPHALKALAEALCSHDFITVASIAEQVKAHGLCNKTVFLAAVREEKSMMQASYGRTAKPSDDELADKWIAKHPNTVFGLGDFRRYGNGYWPVVQDDKVKQEILEELNLAKCNGIKPSSRLLESVYEIARVKVSDTNVTWDNQGDYLPCGNGVLAFSNRTLLPHAPDWYFTNKLNYEYDRFADCPNFLRVINEAIPQAVSFLQEFTGYALTIDTSYEIAVWFYGPPGSGKSSILIGLQSMLGSRAGVLGLADVERSRFGLTNLVGKTLLISTEQPSTYFTATHTLNSIISGEMIEVDRKFRDPIQIEPHAKLAWAMNDLPRIKDPGNGLFRRIKVIHFPPIDESKRDPKIKTAIKTEGAGILNWALDGLDQLKCRKRFEIPDCVMDATNDFQIANDVPAIFVAEKCNIGDMHRERSSILYGAYDLWCYQNGHKAQSITSLGEDLRRLGFTKYEADGRVWWRGIGLKEKKKL